MKVVKELSQITKFYSGAEKAPFLNIYYFFYFSILLLAIIFKVKENSGEKDSNHCASSCFSTRNCF